MLQERKSASWSIYLKIAAGVIFILSLLLLLLWGVHSGTKSKDELEEIDNEVSICNSTECQEASLWIADSLNLEADPCDDFYEFACGKFSSVHPIQANKSYVSTLSLMQEKVTDTLYNILQGNEENESQNSSDQSSNTKKESQSVTLARDLFEVCMDEENRNKLGVEPFREQLKRLLGTEWPITDVQSFDDTFLKSQNKMSLFTQAMARFTATGSQPIIAFGPEIDANNTLHRLITFKVPEFDLEAYQYDHSAEHNDEIGANWVYMRTMVDLFIKERSNVKRDDLDLRFDEIFRFERSLANLVNTKTKNRNNLKDEYFKTSLGNLRTLTGSSNIDWKYLLTKTIENFEDLPYSAFSDLDEVVVTDLEYYQGMARLVAATPLHVVLNYMGVRFISERGDDGDEAMGEVEFNFAKATSGLTRMPYHWEGCLEEVRRLFPMALSRLYVDKVVPPETVLAAEGIVDHVAESFSTIIKSHTPWLDKVTRDRAEEKLAKIKYLVGYPSWLVDNTHLDAHFGLTRKDSLQIIKGKYFESLTAVRQFVIAKNFRELKKVHDPKNDWTMSPVTANADYSTVANTIVIPVGLLQPPLFDPFRPSYMNYATLGVFVGHTLTHHFDDKGSLRDHHERLLDWWSPTTRAHFDNATACFVSQYNSAVNLQTGKKLNGVDSVNENIADNGGIRQAFYAFEKAYQMAVGKNRVRQLVNLEKYNVEQLFFIALAKNTCADYRLEYLKTKIDHALIPPRNRVNLALGNLPYFATSFKCPLSSKMNPSERCRIW